MGYLNSKRIKPSKNIRNIHLAREMDITILLPALVLAIIGVAMIYSATYSKAALSQIYLKQILWLSLGTISLLFFASFNYQALLNRFAVPAYWIIIILLVVLLAAGEQISGSRRWINISGISFQPSEFAKVVTTLVLAKYLSEREDKIKEWQTLLGAFFITGLPMVLILREPDLGTTLVFVPLVFVMLYIVGVPFSRLFWITFAGLSTSPLIWFMLKDYQRQRLLVFINPNMDTLGAGYNVIQSKIAIGSGGWIGKGWLGGTQSQLKFVPEHHTDFIFSVIAEEWGFMGAFILIILFGVFLLQALRIARLARDTAGSLIAVGLTTIIFVQVVINLGGATGLLPVTGMTLPFISYGGSSIILCMSIIGILMSIWSGRKIMK